MRKLAELCVLTGLTVCSAPLAAQQEAIPTTGSIANPFESVTAQNQPVQRSEENSAPAIKTMVPQMDMAPSQSEASAITIGAVNVTSVPQMPGGSLASSYEKFIGMQANEKNLRALASAISQAARDHGYIFASAQIPPQAVKIGVVSVSLDPGPIDKVRIIGSENGRLRTILDELISDAATAAKVERQLLLAGDLPGIHVKSTGYQRDNGRGILVVNVTEDRIRGYGALDNYGTNTLGPVRARINYTVSELLSDDDSLTVNAISSVVQPDELAYLNIRYAATLGDGSTLVGFSGAVGRTFTGGSLRDFNFRGRNRYASVFASHALRRSPEFNLWLNTELGYQRTVQTRDGVRFQEDDIVTASVNFAGNYDVSIGRIYGGIGVTQGLGILGASSSGDLLNSRDNASGRFTKANLWVNSILNFGSGYGARLAANGQIASRPLLASNEIAIGGPYFGKGYDFGERFGDEGVMGLAELRKEFNNVTDWLDWFQLYGFVDGGYVSNIGTGFGDGALASAGGGMRAQIGNVDLGVEAATPVTDDRIESGDKSPKVNMQVGVRF